MLAEDLAAGIIPASRGVRRLDSVPGELFCRRHGSELSAPALRNPACTGVEDALRRVGLMIGAGQFRTRRAANEGQRNYGIIIASGEP